MSLAYEPLPLLAVSNIFLIVHVDFPHSFVFLFRINVFVVHLIRLNFLEPLLSSLLDSLLFLRVGLNVGVLDEESSSDWIDGLLMHLL